MLLHFEAVQENSGVLLIHREALDYYIIIYLFIVKGSSGGMKLTLPPVVDDCDDVGDEGVCGGRKGGGVSRKINKNVKLALWFTFLSSASRTVWSFSVLTNYLYYITSADENRTLFVGISEGIQGGVQAVVAVVAGIAAGRTRTDEVMKYGGVLGIIAVACTLFSLLAPWPWANEGNVRYWMITASVGTWGAYQGVWSTTLETIYADSIPTGKRSVYNTWKFGIMQVSTICGPLLALILFAHWGGKTWRIDVLQKVFCVGAIMSIVPAILLFFFDDGKTLGKESESHATPRSVRKALRNANLQNDRKPHCFEDNNGDDACATSTLDVSVEFDDCTMERESLAPATPSSSERHLKMHNRAVDRTCLGCITLDHVPLMTVVADILSGLGSGMTIKFFPLYFNTIIGLDPVQLNSIYVVLPVVLVLAAFFAQTISRRIGRVPTILLFTAIGACALGAMAAVGHYWDAKDRATAWRVVIPLYFFSTAQHCCRPLKKSILMDYVTKETRARWNSLDSVTRFGWSGSAVLGGLILKYTQNDFGVSFLVTAVLQVLAGLTFVPLLWVLPNIEAERALSVDIEERKNNIRKALLSEFSGSDGHLNDISGEGRGEDALLPSDRRASFGQRTMSGGDYFTLAFSDAEGLMSKSPVLRPLSANKIAGPYVPPMGEEKSMHATI